MGGGGSEEEPPAPLCRTAGAAGAAADLLLALVHGCVPNMAALVHLIEQMFYSGKRGSFPLHSQTISNHACFLRFRSFSMDF